jgi:hypothetical protein
MSNDKKVLDFPRVEVTSVENAARNGRGDAPGKPSAGEWRLWIDRSAERLGIPRPTLEDLIAAIIKDSEKKARDAETAARRQELAARREQERKQRDQKRERERIDKTAKHKRKALEAIVTLCLAGPEAEKEFCGPANDGSDRVDYEMAYEYLARQLNPLQIGAELVRYRRATADPFALGASTHSVARRRIVGAWHADWR